MTYIDGINRLNRVIRTAYYGGVFDTVAVSLLKQENKNRRKRLLDIFEKSSSAYLVNNLPKEHYCEDCADFWLRHLWKVRGGTLNGYFQM